MVNLSDFLRCPICKGKFKIEPDYFICQSCNSNYKKSSGVIDMMPPKLDYHINQNANLWDNIEYDKLISQRNPKMLRTIDEPFIEHAEGIVLEVGCGNARLAKRIERKGCEYIGIDPVQKMIQEGYNKGVNKLVRGVGEYLPFSDNVFDTIIGGYHSFKYIELNKSFLECARVLNPGGIFVFSLYNYWPILIHNTIFNIRNLKIPPLKLSQNKIDNDVFWAKKEKRLLEKCGFEVVSIIGTPWLNFMNSILGSGKYLNGSVRSMMGHDIIFISKKPPI